MNMVYRSSLRRAGIGLALLLFVAVGCRSPQPVVVAPEPVRLTIVGAPDLNSAGSESGAALSARVRLYELAGETNFKTSTLESFWRDDTAALGQELVASRQILLYPDSSEVVVIQPGADTRYIGVAANLRLPDPQQWRQVFPVETLRGRAVRVEVGADRVTVHLP